MRLSDESVIEGGHLTPEERIALQAEEIKQLRQENEQLRAQVGKPTIEQVAWVAKCICQNADEQGTFRHLIYGIMGYDGEAYQPLYEAGLFRINNNMTELTPEQVEALQQENEQLRAQVARIPDICKWWDGWSCTAYQSDEMKCPHCCPNWEGNNKHVDYHNPADVEALRRAREWLDRIADVFWNDLTEKAQEGIEQALAEIDKAIGGKEDAGNID